MRWAIEIQSTKLERRNLEDLLERLGLVVVDEAPHVAFTSGQIDQCATASEAFQIAKKVQSAFAGAANIDTSFALGSVIDYSRSPASRHAFLEIHEAIHFHATSDATLTVSPGPGLSEDALRIWHEKRAEAEYQAKLESQLSLLEPAYFSPKGAKVLELLAAEVPTGETLFKIYELMRGPRANAAAFGQQYGITAEQYRRFSDVVHNDTVSGDWARHAHGDPPSTSNPMTRAEAESFVRKIAQQWLQNNRSARGS